MATTQSADSQKTTGETSNTSPASTSSPKKSSKIPMLLIIGCGCILVCCIVAAIAAGIFYYIKNKDKNGDVYNKSPFVDVIKPSSSPSFAVAENSVTLSGISSDDNQVKKVEWKVDGGSSGTASGTKEWKIESISLKEGDNKITITAYDDSNNKGEDKITVTYNEDVIFIKEPKLSQDSIFKDDPAAAITIRANIKSKSGKPISSVKLFQVDSDDQITQELGTMLDNGNTINGDDVPGDGNYAYISDFQSSSSEAIRLRIEAKVQDSSKTGQSGIFKIVVVDHISQQTQDQIDELNQQVQNLMNQLNQQNQQSIASQVLTTVQNNPNVANSGMSPNGNGVWWIYENTCIPGGVLISPPNTKGSTQQTLANSFANSLLTSPVNAQGGESKVMNTKAIYLGPYLSDFGETDDYYGAWQTIKQSVCPQCQTVEKSNSEVTVEDFKNLDQYGIVVVSSHGDSWYGGLSGNDVCAEGLAQTQVIIYTNQDLTNENMATYEADLMARRLAVGYNNKLIILPKYIEQYNSSFPNSLVYIATCRSTFNNTMAAAFLGKGAGVYYGFDDYVLSSYCKSAGNELFNNFLIQGQNAQTAFSNATSVAGSSDGNGADFNMIGGESLIMGGKDFENVGFESGDMSGWGGLGDQRIITSLGSIQPTQGSFMAIISTGLGSVNESDSNISQEVCYGKSGGTLKFDYNLVSEEPTEWLNSSYDDRLEATVTINGTPTVILNKGVNDSSWNPVSGINFSGGDDTTFITGWQTASFSLASVTPGAKLMVNFRVFDKGDSDYDTAALIDNIRIE